MNHRNARQYSDSMVCTDCGRSWDVNDPEPPPCVPAKKVKKLIRPEQWMALKEALRTGDWSKVLH